MEESSSVVSRRQERDDQKENVLWLPLRPVPSQRNHCYRQPRYQPGQVVGGTKRILAASAGLCHTINQTHMEDEYLSTCPHITLHFSADFLLLILNILSAG